jgi:tripartite-type tricarboxylate transporter receptor subunit TctC
MDSNSRFPHHSAVSLPDRRRVIVYLGAATCGAAATALTGGKAHAAWPDRPVKIVVPFGAGGPPDLVARVLADPLAKELNATVVVENRPGAGGTTGVTGVARAEPDGYTLLIATSAYIVNKALNDKLSYDPIADFTPICEIANAPNVFVVNANLGVNSLRDFVAYAKRQPNGVNYSSPGLGTTPQLCCELLRVRAGIPMEHVPYNSGPQAVQALLTNLVQLFCSAFPLVRPHIESGKLKPIAVTSATRWRGLPEVPTMQEAGFDDFVLDTMVMLTGPARLPTEITTKVSNVLQMILKQPGIRQSLERGGFDVVAKPQAALAARIAKEVPMWRDIVTVTGLKRE